MPAWTKIEIGIRPGLGRERKKSVFYISPPLHSTPSSRSFPFPASNLNLFHFNPPSSYLSPSSFLRSLAAIYSGPFDFIGPRRGEGAIEVLGLARPNERNGFRNSSRLRLIPSHIFYGSQGNQTGEEERWKEEGRRRCSGVVSFVVI